VPRPAPSTGALDQAGNVGHHEALAGGQVHHAEVGGQGGERIVGDLRLGGAGGGQEGRLAGVGQADQADVGDQLQPQPDPQLLAFLTGIGELGSLVDRALEVQVAPAAVAALGQAQGHAGGVHVGDQGLLVLLQHLGADGDLQDDVVARRAVARPAHAVDARPGLEVLLVAVVDQGVEALDRLDPDVAASAAVPAVGAAVFDVLLASERDRAAAAVAGADIDFALVQEFHERLLSQGGFRVEPKPAYGQALLAFGAGIGFSDALPRRTMFGIVTKC
jgi:hypothetical protein